MTTNLPVMRFADAGPDAFVPLQPPQLLPKSRPGSAAVSPIFHDRNCFGNGRAKGREGGRVGTKVLDGRGFNVASLGGS